MRKRLEVAVREPLRFRGPSIGRALGEVLPSFQLQKNVEQPVSVDQPDARGAVAAVLACAIQPFKLDGVFRVSCGGERFETESEALRDHAAGRLCRDAWMQSVFFGRRPGEAALLRAG